MSESNFDILIFSEQTESRRAELLESIAGLYRREFGDYTDPANELAENPAIWLGKMTTESHPRIEVFVAHPGDTDGGMAGFLVAEYFKECRCALLTYCAVEEAYRGQGVARQLTERAIAWLKAYSGDSLKAVFAEFEDPRYADGSGDEERRRLGILLRLGARILPFNYLQPALAADKARAKGLFLAALDLAPDSPTLDLAGDVVGDFLWEFFSRCEGKPREALAQDAQFLEMLADLDDWSKGGREISLAAPQSSFQIGECAIAFQFEMDVPATALQAATGKFENLFESFQRDLLSYAYCQEPPFTTQNLLDVDHELEIEVELGSVVGYEIEGLDYGLSLPHQSFTARLHLHATHFRRSGRTILHCVLTPKLVEGHCLSEYDLLRLTTLWAGKGAFEKVIFGAPIFSLALESGKVVESSLLSLVRKVVGSRLPELHRSGKWLGDGAVGGVLQVSLPNPQADSGCGQGQKLGFDSLRSALDTLIRRHKPDSQAGNGDPPPIDPAAAQALKALGGFSVNILDFDNVDDNELADTLQRAYRDPTKIVVIHRGSLVFIAENDRNLTDRKDEIGISPYLLIPQAVLVHNELALRNTAELSASSGGSGNLPGLEKRLEKVSRVLNLEYVQNIFQYPTERWIYREGGAIRGLNDLLIEMRGAQDSLKEEVSLCHQIRDNAWDRAFVVIGLFLAALQVKDTVSEYLGKIHSDLTSWTVEVVFVAAALATGLLYRQYLKRIGNVIAKR